MRPEAMHTGKQYPCQQYTESRSYAEDLTEGKFNFPCIHAIRSRPDDTRVINIIRQRTTDVEVR